MTATSTAVSRGVSPATFFVVTLGVSWALWVPLMLIRLERLPRVVPLDALTPLALVGVLVPAAAATVLTARAAGRSAVGELWRRLGRWRVGTWWWAALALQPALLVATALSADALSLGEVAFEPGLTVPAVVAAVAFLAIAGTGEEVGWRGLALPALQSRYDAARASVVLALVTATWHLPYWILQGALEDRGPGYLVLNYVFILALTFQLTWLFNATGGSVLVAVAFHLSFNTVNVAILPVTGSTGAFALLTALECLVSLSLWSRLTPARRRT